MIQFESLQKSYLSTKKIKKKEEILYKTCHTVLLEKASTEQATAGEASTGVQSSDIQRYRNQYFLEVEMCERRAAIFNAVENK